ncbi:hypothetical protein [Actinocorallia sp. A-T 12471]|uniref:hypothetical protein n=1 Tax=Actinocorallia sp. A-T 12471 TaxID=3089813 RepID=UPI0029D32DE3|nr:hypothetical protein [Actinocorallia sp. A-T 12471]MDX6740224.1 hypothetical protein [Actinocorallia sp. A-T 12471]
MTDADVSPAIRRISAILPGWRTVDTPRRVLLVLHSATAAARIADLIPALQDPRLHLFCACTSDSVFPGRIDRFLRTHEIDQLTWEQATALEFDAAITASLGDNLHEITCPILRIPHGNGYNKRWIGGSADRRIGGSADRRIGGSVFGLSEETLKHEGRLVPAAIGLSHDEQLGRLAEGCPEAVPLAFVAGDPCYDRMLASLSRRLNYRHAFGLRPGQKLITIASTWREDSLFGIDPLLASRLLAELPFDRYRVALVLHPNIWASHSAFQIRAWLAEALRAGLILLPPEEGWRAAVIAADWVLSDHGSVGVYAAAVGRPVLLEQSGAAMIDPRSGIGMLFDAAPPLDPHSALEPQLRRAEEARDRTHTIASALVSSAPGRALHLIRERLYTMMGEPPPVTEPPAFAVENPEVDAAPPASLWTNVRQTARNEFEVERRPAAIQGAGPGVLIVADRELDHHLAAKADVIWTTRDALPADEPTWSATVFAHRPGLTLTLVKDGPTARFHTRENHITDITVTDPESADLTLAVLAERLISGTQDLTTLNPLTLHLGPTQTLTTTFSTTPT